VGCGSRTRHAFKAAVSDEHGLWRPSSRRLDPPARDHPGPAAPTPQSHCSRRPRLGSARWRGPHDDDRHCRWRHSDQRIQLLTGVSLLRLSPRGRRRRPENRMIAFAFLAPMLGTSTSATKQSRRSDRIGLGADDRIRPEGGASRAAAGRSLRHESDRRHPPGGVIAPDGEHSCAACRRRDRLPRLRSREPTSDHVAASGARQKPKRPSVGPSGAVPPNAQPLPLWSGSAREAGCPYRAISAARIGQAGGHGRELASRRIRGSRNDGLPRVLPR
jgi:hypothetical protein